jgi:hypothetical protein
VQAVGQQLSYSGSGQVRDEALWQLANSPVNAGYPPAAAADETLDSLAEAFTFTVGALSEGSHTVTVRATDVSGNTTPPDRYASRTFFVDTTPPVITINQPQPVPYLHSAMLVLDYGASDGGGSGVASIVATLDGATMVADGGLASGTPIHLLTALPLGVHTFTVDATDNVGLSSTASVAFNVIVTPESIKDEVTMLTAKDAPLQRILTSPERHTIGAAAPFRGGSIRSSSSKSGRRPEGGSIPPRHRSRSPMPTT